MKPGGIKVRRPWQEFLQAMDTLQSFQHAERNDTASVDVHGRPDATSPVYAWIPQENREEPQFDFCFSDYAKAQRYTTISPIDHREDTMHWRTTFPTVILLALALLVLGYLVTHIWYLFIPHMEAFTVRRFIVDGEPTEERVCRVVRLGNEYLIPLVAAQVLFGLQARMEDEGERIVLSDGKNLEMELRLYDPVVRINRQEKMLRAPAIESRAPMVPIRLLEQALHREIRPEIPDDAERAPHVRAFVTSLLQERVTLLNLVMGTLFTGLWVSMGHFTRAAHRGETESRFWRLLPYLLLGLILLCYMVQLVTSTVEKAYF